MFIQSSKRFYLIAQAEDIWTQKAQWEFDRPVFPRHNRVDLDYLHERYQRLYDVYMNHATHGNMEAGIHYRYLKFSSRNYNSLSEDCLRSPLIVQCKNGIIKVEGKKFKGWRQSFMRHLRKELDLLSRTIIKYIHLTKGKPKVVTINVTAAEMYCICLHYKWNISVLLQQYVTDMELEEKYRFGWDTLYIAVYENRRAYVFSTGGMIHKYATDKNRTGYPKCLNMYIQKFGLHPRDIGRFFGLE